MDDAIFFEICEKIRIELYMAEDKTYTPNKLLQLIVRNFWYQSADVSAAMCHLWIMGEIELSDDRRITIA